MLEILLHKIKFKLIYLGAVALLCAAAIYIYLAINKRERLIKKLNNGTNNEKINYNSDIDFIREQLQK